MLSEKDLIKKCKRYNLAAQQELYNRYAGVFKQICLRYSTGTVDVDDVLQESFISIYKSIKSYKEKGSFEGWMKRIVVNTALQHYKRQKTQKLQYNLDELHVVADDSDQVNSGNHKIDRSDVNDSEVDYVLIQQADFSCKDIQDCSLMLKEELRIVFNLYFFEQYKHKEIGEILNIDESSSRTRLQRAREKMQTILYEKCLLKVTV